MTTYLVFELLTGGYIYVSDNYYPFGKYSPFFGHRPIYKIRVIPKT